MRKGREGAYTWLGPLGVVTHTALLAPAAMRKTHTVVHPDMARSCSVCWKKSLSDEQGSEGEGETDDRTGVVQSRSCAACMCVMPNLPQHRPPIWGL